MPSITQDVPYRAKRPVGALQNQDVVQPLNGVPLVIDGETRVITLGSGLAPSVRRVEGRWAVPSNLKS